MSKGEGKYESKIKLDSSSDSSSSTSSSNLSSSVNNTNVNAKESKRRKAGWECKLCTFFNTDALDRCLTCLTPRQTIWKCDVCTFINASNLQRDNHLCGGCGKFNVDIEMKKVARYPNGTWDCPECAVNNSFEQDMCLGCGHDYFMIDPLPDRFKGPVNKESKSRSNSSTSSSITPAGFDFNSLDAIIKNLDKSCLDSTSGSDQKRPEFKTAGRNLDGSWNCTRCTTLTNNEPWIKLCKVCKFDQVEPLPDFLSSDDVEWESHQSAGAKRIRLEQVNNGKNISAPKSKSSVSDSDDDLSNYDIIEDEYLDANNNVDGRITTAAVAVGNDTDTDIDTDIDINSSRKRGLSLSGKSTVKLSVESHVQILMKSLTRLGIDDTDHLKLEIKLYDMKTSQLSRPFDMVYIYTHFTSLYIAYKDYVYRYRTNMLIPPRNMLALIQRMRVPQGMCICIASSCENSLNIYDDLFKVAGYKFKHDPTLHLLLPRLVNDVVHN